ncbi:MAG: CHAT domain-containing protein, partial [Planctomycetes bacterium]|nr:CHAT domain-containing protein [Planctomycetota bacterium]
TNARALEILEESLGVDHPTVAAIVNNRAKLLDALGQFEEARTHYERALAITEKRLGLEHPEVAQVLFNLAQLLETQGEWDEAGLLYQRSLAIREKVFDSESAEIAESYSGLGGIFDRRGEVDLAQDCYQRGLAIYENTLGWNHPVTAAAANNYAGFLRREGFLDEAKKLYQRSQQALEDALGPTHPDLATSLINLAAILNEQEAYDESRRLYERCLRILEDTLGPAHPMVATCLNNLAFAFSDQGDFQSAFALRIRRLQGVLAYLDQQLPSMSEPARLRLLQISGNPENLLDCALKLPDLDLTEAYSNFQQWKGKATRLQSANVRLSQLGVTPEIVERKEQIQLLAKELSGLVLLPLSEQKENHSTHIDQLRRQRIRLERELNRQIGLDIVLNTPDLAEVQAGLPADSVLVDFLVGIDAYAWVVKSSGSPELISLGDCDELHQAQVAFLRTHAVRGGRPFDASESDPAAAYLALLWQPLREAVGNSKTVFICPDGFLCELPFGILQESDGSFLLEKHRFSYLSDPTSLALKSPPSAIHEGPLLAVGGVNYFRRDDVVVKEASPISTRSRVGDSWSSLPATRDEMQSLRDLHDYILEWQSPMTSVEGKAATEERIRAELPGKRYVHIATHGYFEPDHLPSLLLDAVEKQADAQFDEQIQAVGLLPGLLSGLVFAGVNGEPDPTRDDGYLSAEEIQHLDLSACDLVVLSACETALGSARAGEGLMSLRRAFSVAGAATVVSSLWKVDDKATAQLMKDFYTHLWEKEMSRGVALHEAKLRMLRRNRIEHGGDAMPNTWGAFVLSGNPN